MLERYCSGTNSDAIENEMGPRLNLKFLILSFNGHGSKENVPKTNNVTENSSH